MLCVLCICWQIVTVTLSDPDSTDVWHSKYLKKINSGFLPPIAEAGDIMCLGCPSICVYVRVSVDQLDIDLYWCNCMMCTQGVYNSVA